MNRNNANEIKCRYAFGEQCQINKVSLFDLMNQFVNARKNKQISEKTHENEKFKIVSKHFIVIKSKR